MLSSSASVNLAAQPVDPNKALRIARGVEYPKEVWYFVACAIALISFFHLLSFTWSRLQKAFLLRHISSGRASDNSSGEGPRSPNPMGSVSVRRLPMAVSSAFRIVVFRWTVKLGRNFSTTLAEIGVIAGYLIAILIWEFINTRNVTTHKNLDLDYWSNRAGTIAASQMSLIVALAGKNNIISLFTGITYEKLNIVHRGVARVVLLMVWIHLWGKWKYGFVGDLSLDHPWVRGGILAGAAYTLLIVISVRPLRSAAYEIFYYSHFVLVLIMLFSAYYHIQQANVTMGVYIWPALLVWAIDRAIRLGRVFLFNVPFLHSNTSPSTVELLSQDAIRVTVRRRNITWRPGQSMFLNLPKISSLPFESHPFTISSVASSQNNGEKELVFLIKARSGVTGRLRDAARDMSAKTVKVILDGPYGSPPDLSSFSTVLLFSGGSGVSYCLPLLTDVIRRTRENKAVCRRVVFVWAVRVPEHMHWISDTLVQILAEVPSHLQVDVRIQVTARISDVLPTLEKTSPRPTDSSDEDLSKSESEDKEGIDSEPELAKTKGVSIVKGRPDIRRILEEEVSCANGPVSVDVCGPHALSEAVRSALASDIAGPMGVLRGRESVTLHVEKFSMA